MSILTPNPAQPVCVAFVPGGKRQGLYCHRCGHELEEHLLARVETYHPATLRLMSTTVVSVAQVPKEPVYEYRPPPNYDDLEESSL